MIFRFKIMPKHAMQRWNDDSENSEEHPKDCIFFFQFLFFLYFFFFFLAAPLGLWDLSFPTRDWTHGSWQSKGSVLTTGPSGNSQNVYSYIQNSGIKASSGHTDGPHWPGHRAMLTCSPGSGLALGACTSKVAVPLRIPTLGSPLLWFPGLAGDFLLCFVLFFEGFLLFGPFLKLLLNLLQCRFCFMFWFFGHKHVGS